MEHTAMTTNSGSLKAKIKGCEETIGKIIEEINYQKKEITTLRSEKNTLEQLLKQKADDVRDQLSKQKESVEGEMKRTFIQQKGENNKLQ